MWMWIYCLLATAYFLQFQNYLLFIRDTAYRNIIWNSENSLDIDLDAMNDYLKANYKLPARLTAKVGFLFISPLFLVYVLFYIIKRLDY
jgi:hypothetical protein